MSLPIRAILSIDAENYGLIGDPYAVGFTVTDFEGHELESGYIACPFETAKGTIAGREYSLKNVLPLLPEVPANEMYENPDALCEAVYQLWMRVKSQYQEVLMVVDYGFPVETSMLERGLKLHADEREYNGPLPLYDVAPALLVAKIDRKTFPRLPNELPEHHPVNDARYAARLFLEVDKKVGGLFS